MTGSLHALGAVLLGTSQDAEHGAVAHLWMRVAVEGPAHHLFHMRPELGTPTEHALGRPAAVVLVRFRSMLGKSDGGALASVAAVMARDAHPTVAALDDAGCRPDVDELLAKLVGDAVVASVEFNVVVDVGAGSLALGDLEAQRRQRLHRRQVQGFEGLAAVARELLKVSLVELFDELGDGVVESAKLKNLRLRSRARIQR
jgi:hypothetical protein